LLLPHVHHNYYIMLFVHYSVVLSILWLLLFMV